MVDGGVLNWLMSRRECGEGWVVKGEFVKVTDGSIEATCRFRVKKKT
jgi:hypothetical protein